MISKPLTKEMLENACSRAIKIIELNSLRFSDCFPFMNTEADGKYRKRENDDMGSGFWAGTYILAYEITGDRKYLYLVSKYLDMLYSRFFRENAKAITEMGFIYVPSCVLANRITNNKKCKTAVIMAADILNSMYRKVDGAYLVNHNYLTPGKDSYVPIKISAMINCSVLYWASEFSGMDGYKNLADDVIDFIANNLIGGSGAAYWEYDIDKGPLRKGEIIGSDCRAISWGLYGLAIKYRRTKDAAIYAKIVKLLNIYMPEIMSADLSTIDSTMLISLACAIYDIADCAGEDFKKYEDFADSLLANIIEDFSLEPLRKTDGILGNAKGFGSHNFLQNVLCTKVSTTIGDYFYTEALVRKLMKFESYF